MRIEWERVDYRAPRAELCLWNESFPLPSPPATTPLPVPPNLLMNIRGSTIATRLVATGDTVKNDKSFRMTPLA